MGFPVVALRKEDGEPRFCIDYKALNKKTNVNRFPIPINEEILDDISGATVLTQLDFIETYWQIPLAEHVHEMMAFNFKYRAFRFSVLSSGLLKAPALFPRIDIELLGDPDLVKSYTDDDIIY